MRSWDASRVARAAGARLLAPSAASRGSPGPLRASIDSRELAGGELFIGLSGERVDGGEHAVEALRAGAWGVLVAPEHAGAAADCGSAGAVLEHPDPLRALQALAASWRVELQEQGAKVVAVTGSTGKTSTKDILAALLGGHARTVASSENLNTEIGLPLAILAAPAGTQALVLELAMRGAGQIAELTAIAQPDVGVIVNVGPVHLELLGSLEAVAAAKAELIACLRAGAAIVIPAGEPLLEPHLRGDLETLTFGPGGEVELLERGNAAPGSEEREVTIRFSGAAVNGGAEQTVLRPSFAQAHNLSNLLAAVAAARALGITPRGELSVRFSSLRGERVQLPGDVVVINDCYNANPMSMRSALDDLAASAPGRRVAVLGDMLELGAGARRFHRAVGRHANERGVDLLVMVGPLAAEMRTAFDGESYAVADAAAAVPVLASALREGDTVLIKASRGVGLERVAAALPEQWRDRPRRAGEAALSGPRAEPRRG